MLDLNGEVAVVTGAGSVGDDPDATVWGNGKATAVLLARQGAKVFGVDLREEAVAVTMSEESWDTQINHNLKTAFLGCKYVIPVMEKQGKGSIVNIASIAGLRMSADRAHVAYSTTKLGLFAFSKSTAITHAKQGIRCNTVVPGLMHTALVEHRLAKTIGANDLQGLIDRRNAQCPTGKMGNAWDVAHAVLFLASDEAGYISGTEIIVDGGLTAASSSV